jgi:hypothetical protein
MDSEQGFYGWEDTIHQHAYILLCQLFALSEFEKLAHWGGPPDAFQTLLGREEPEFNKNIMTLAALARANDDAGRGLGEYMKRNPEGVGTLTVDGNEEILTAREACNKIIHSKVARVETIESREHPVYAKIHKSKGIVDTKTYQLPLLYLSGRQAGKKGKEWAAKVNLIRWVIAVAFFGA